MGRLDLWGLEPRNTNSLLEDVWKMFNDFDRGVPAQNPWTRALQTSMTPACDLSETKEGYLLTFDLPGLRREDINIDVTDRRLVVSGERKWDHEEKDVNYFRRERSYGQFSRTFELPEATNVEGIEASYENGVLRLAVPKAAETRARKIQIGETPRGFLRKITGKPEIKVANSKN